MPKLDEYLTIKAAAAYLGVCQNTLRNWGNSGKIKECRNPLNGYRLYAPQDLEALLRNIQESGEYPTGWAKPLKRKPR
jgi:DNA-binding transcriptional MerR regulator